MTKWVTEVRQAIYDCIYLAPAIDNDCLMVTADERFINAVRQNSDVDSVLWLATFAQG